MAAQPVRRQFSVAEYYQMGASGILHENDRVELIDGEVIEMPPIGDLHAWCVNRLTRLFILGFGDAVVVSVQNPLRLNERSEPVPDVVVMRPRSELRGPHPTPADTLLVVEVSDTTLRYDQRRKVPLYAAQGVPEVWIVDLKGERILLHRDPAEGSYRETLIVRRGDRLASAAFPNIEFTVDDILSYLQSSTRSRGSAAGAISREYRSPVPPRSGVHRVADVGPNLPPMVLRLGQKLGSFGCPFTVDLLDIRHPHVQERAGPVRISRRLKRPMACRQ